MSANNDDLVVGDFGKNEVAAVTKTKNPKKNFKLHRSNIYKVCMGLFHSY